MNLRELARGQSCIRCGADDGTVVLAHYTGVRREAFGGGFGKKVHDAVVAAFNDPAVKEAMAKQGNTISISTTEQAQAAFRTELAKYAALVKKVGLEPQ